MSRPVVAIQSAASMPKAFRDGETGRADKQCSVLGKQKTWKFYLLKHGKDEK